MEEIEFWKEWTVDHRPAHSTYSWNTEGTADMQTAFGVLFVLSRLLCHSDSPAFCHPVLPPKSPLPPPLPAIAPVTLGYLADQNLSPSTQNIWKAPREICLKSSKNQELLQKINLGHKRRFAPFPTYTVRRHKLSTLLMMSWYGTSHLVISCHDMSVKTLNLTKPAPWGQMDTNSEFCPCIPASKRHWWPQHGGKWWKFLRVVNQRSTEWKYKGSDTRLPSNIAWKKIFQQLAFKGTSLAEALKKGD